MQRERIESSNIVSLGHDPVNQVLELEFGHGGVYRFRGVPLELVQGLREAPSKGVYFHAHIKPFGGEKVLEG